MSEKVGIPRALFFHKFYPFWITFFNELGLEPIVSGKTTKNILDAGVKNCIDEACLAVKIFFGHVVTLRNKVDSLFIPRFTSVSHNEYVCPKFGGLPDMVKHSLDNLPYIIKPEVNMRKSKKSSFKAAMETGRYFCSNKNEIKKAYSKALIDYKEYRRKQKIDLTGIRRKAAHKLRIAVIGHVYNLYDNYVNMDLFKKLDNMDVEIVTTEMVDKSIIMKKSEILPKKMFWYFGTQAVGSVLHFMETDIDGIIYLMTFGCGIDAFVCDLVERKLRRNTNIPFITLTLDEHTGEAGLNTRLEAFIDMIRFSRNKIFTGFNPLNKKYMGGIT